MSQKKKVKGLVKYLPYVVLVFGVAAFAMLFLNALKTGEGENVDYTKATDVVFGIKQTILGQSAELKFSFLGLLAFVLPLIAGVLALIPLDKKKNNLKFLICAVLFVLGALFAFIMPSYTKVYYETILGSGTLDVDYSLAIGTILCGVLSGLGAFTSAAVIVLK